MPRYLVNYGIYNKDYELVISACSREDAEDYGYEQAVIMAEEAFEELPPPTEDDLEEFDNSTQAYYDAWRVILYNSIKSTAYGPVSWGTTGRDNEDY
jgi:hypothetical protein